jgi:hypothetical protein
METEMNLLFPRLMHRDIRPANIFHIHIGAHGHNDEIQTPVFFDHGIFGTVYPATAPCFFLRCTDFERTNKTQQNKGFWPIN